MIEGIDVSAWNGRVDWTKASQRARFAYIKLTEGTVADAQGATNWTTSKGVIMRGGYMYFHPEIDGVLQALAFIRQMGGDFGDLPPAVDVEEPQAVWGDSMRENLRACLAELRASTYWQPVVYTGGWYVPYVLPADWLAEYPLWIAAYISTQAVQTPAPWSSFVLHQYGVRTDGWDYGCAAVSLDHDLFVGDEISFAQFARRPISTTPPVITVNGQAVHLPLTIGGL